MVDSPTQPPLVRGRWVPMSYEEFLAWAPDGARTEWTAGEGIVYATAGDRHQAMIMFASSLLVGFVRLFGLGRANIAPYPMALRPSGPHREPDVLFWATANLHRWTPQRLKGPADLAWEILS